jgi:hypothetical protein
VVTRQRALWIVGIAAHAMLASAVPATSPLAGTARADQRDRVLDLSGRIVDPLDQPGARAIVVIFTRTDCPIANRYAPEVRRLRRTFGPRRVAFRLVYLDAGEPVQAIRAHLRQYGYDIPAVRDPDHVLVSLTGARTTPEVAVFTGERRMVYRGRIDDRYLDLNKVRPSPTRHDVRDVLAALLAGTPVQPRTTDAVGCLIADLQ